MDGNIRIEKTMSNLILRICGEGYILPDRWVAERMAEALDRGMEVRIRMPDTDGHIYVEPVLGGTLGTRLVCLKDAKERTVAAAVVDGWETADAIRDAIKEAA